MEGLVKSAVKTIEENSGIISQTCAIASQWFACASSFLPCIDSNGPGSEGIPLLPCDSDCSAWWAVCQEAFNSYGTVILNGDYSKSSTVSCVNGTFRNAQGVALAPPDVYGGRSINDIDYFPIGYNGTLRWPLEFAIYKMSNGTEVQTACYHPVEPTSSVFNAGKSNASCVLPLITFVDASGDQTCLVPCPFTATFTLTDIEQVQLGFVAPAFLGLFFCTLVLIDSLWVIYETTGGFNCGKIRKTYLFSLTSTTSDEANVSGPKSHRPIKATTKYTTIGSMLGILYFCLGPLPTLLRGPNVSCGEVNSSFPLASIPNGGVDFSDAACKAQRFAPFALQLCFNLILYVIVRLMQVVKDQSRTMTARQKLFYAASLRLYCFGLPILLFIIAISIDAMSTDTNIALAQIIRQSYICLMRFENPNTEIILVYVPFIITGALVSGLSISVLTSITRIRDKVAQIRSTANNRQAEWELSLRMFMMRLAILGLSTFCVLIILMVTTSLFEQQVNAYTTLWISWFECGFLTSQLLSATLNNISSNVFFFQNIK